jgi:hypothetical protein
MTGPHEDHDAGGAHPPERLDALRRRIVLRPDGYHWVTSDGHEEFGPFETWEAAALALQDGDEGAPEEGESVAEAEAEIGLGDWIDPATGLPAEGGCPPHVDENDA